MQDGSWPLLPAVLEATHGLAHLLRRPVKIPLRIGDVYMPEIGRQHRQQAVGILAALVPAHERIRRESMTHVMLARSVAVGRATQADLPRQRVESLMNLRGIQAIAPVLDEHVVQP